MGEYVLWRGRLTKLGTLEDLFYVRYSDLVGGIALGLAAKDRNSAAPAEYLAGPFRFRFPFPDEDRAAGAPGYDDWNYTRGVTLPWPEGLESGPEHNTVWVNAPAIGEGYTLTAAAQLACPQDPAAPAELWHTNGGRVLQLIQQRPVEGALWAVCRCPYCGALWRLPPGDGEALAAAIEAEQPELAARIREGYAVDVAADIAALTAPRGEA